MQPIRTLTLSLLAGLVLVLPAFAGDHGGHAGHGKGKAKGDKHEGACSCGMKDHGMAGHHPMGMGHGDMHGKHAGMGHRKHRRMGHMGLSPADRAFVNKFPPRDDAADFSWHPNRLRASAIEFMANDVYRLAILPFNDLSALAPVDHAVNPVWAERMLRDTLAGSLLETGILVLPAENIEAAVIELKGFGNIRTSIQAYQDQLIDPYGLTFQQSAELIEMSDLTRETAENLIARDRKRSMPQRSAIGLGALGTDYTPEEIRRFADALDVDGVIIGSISSWGMTKSNTFFDMFSRSSGELVVNVYLLDGATGEPIYGTRQEVHRSSDWFRSSRGKAMVDGLAKKFSGSLMKELSHPVPMWYVDHLRHIYGVDRPQRDYHHRGGKKRDDGVAVSSDANIQRWKRYTHHVDSNDRVPRDERVAAEVREEKRSRVRKY